MIAIQVGVGLLVFSLLVLGLLRRLKVFQKPASFIWGNETNWKVKTNGLLAAVGTVLVFVVAYLLQEQSIYINCEDVAISPHAVWHALCGIGFLSVYLTLFRAEDFSTCESDSQDSKLKKAKSTAHVEESN
eukprot:CAMPEP_0204870542 /NCGR_PEP_ID=MMETSP1348-20121228/32742_1 /ASSEMBLY_ACC=CAM_ASM_000700 /TAXON_ID=215587 /ORGANISM="Aplanochytrium stocchinoi, Strain GSBS06" /LENGTH=130 /DNA_ID=CAMNT_0052024387 /DNA_START=173 /DNA_END=565 /DNA_ORIENTATION=-